MQEMDTIEGDPSRPSSISTMADDTKRWARELCSIWVSVMQGRPANIARGILDQNGYEAWRNLTLEMQPSSRQRQLALMATFRGPLRPREVALGAGDALRGDHCRV